MNFAGNFLLKVAQSPGCVRGLIRLHLSYCTMRTMFWLKELKFYFNQFCGGVIRTLLGFLMGVVLYLLTTLFIFGMAVIKGQS